MYVSGSILAVCLPAELTVLFRSIFLNSIFVKNIEIVEKKYFSKLLIQSYLIVSIKLVILLHYVQHIIGTAIIFLRNLNPT